MLEAVASMLRTMSALPVFTAHMELAEPTLGQAFGAAVAAGAEHVFVFPYFLSPGRHSRQDIPRMCAEVANAHPGVRWHCSGPIGLDPLLGELILRRVNRCESHGYDCESCPDRRTCR